MNIGNASNINIPGRFIYEISGENIQHVEKKTENDEIPHGENRTFYAMSRLRDPKTFNLMFLILLPNQKPFCWPNHSFY